MNHTKLVLQIYPVNADGMRDGLSGDRGVKSVPYSFSPLNQKLLPMPLIMHSYMHWLLHKYPAKTSLSVSLYPITCMSAL